MTLTTSIGIIGGIILVIGSARSEKKSPENPRKSVKDRFFAIGGCIMLIYAILGYKEGGNIFYIFLEGFLCLASILMMLRIRERSDILILGILGLGLVITSFIMEQSKQTLRFIFGLIGTAFGYILKSGTRRRDTSLALGSLLIAIFSIIESNRIFFSINIIFCLFSIFYLLKDTIEKKK